jgi:uncharacterized protein (TIGR02687 family)
MDIKQIKDTLNRIFSEKNKRIIFWYDGEKEFEEILPSLQLDGVSILRLDEHGALELKIKLESEDTTGKYILYAPYHETPPEKDWLVDIRLYSYTFHADKASIILKELDLANQSMRPFLQKRRDFFKSQDRLNRLKKWVSPDDTEEDLDLKMLAVITRADQPEPFSILMNLLASFCMDGKVNLIEPSKPWKDIEKLGLRPAFCQILARTFGYTTADLSNLIDFLLRVFVSDFSNSLKTELPEALSHFVIQSPTQQMNSSVFLSQWRSNTGHFKNFNLISEFIAKKLKIDDVLITLDIESLLDTMTFESIERRIISAFRNQIGTDSEKDYQELREAIKLRRDSYWATTVLSEDSQENLYRTVYHALEAAIELFELRKKYDAGLSFSGAENMFNAYISELFLFDQLYRRFYELSDKADLAGWDVLKSLREAVENCYSDWFMDQLSLKWGDFLESENADSLLRQWKIPFITNQYDFFKKHIEPTLKESSRNRLFVIISDAFRFEAAEELYQKINGTYRLKAELEPMLGILPSYTALGMAALLPHNTLSFKESPAADILVDGKPAGSLDQRADILSNYHGTAIKADNLMSMSKDSGREFVKPHRLIYIFHDRIDAIGDKAVSESNTFEAVRKTINDLFALVRFIIDSLNGTRILITADHGFIYQEKAPAPIDKSRIEINPKDTVKTHKRFILGKNLVSSDRAYFGNTKTSANTDTEMDFLLAKGTNRFSFSGGARFFHGGAMPQEIVVPVVMVSEMKGKRLVESEVKQVGVSLLGSYKKLVTNRPVYRFIQTDPVSDRIKPITLKVSLRDKNELISSEETVTFDSSSSSMDERQKTVKLTLKTGSYDNKKTYSLVLRNIDDTEYDRIPIIIDIAFANDF